MTREQRLRVVGVRAGARVVEVAVALAAADGVLRFLDWWHRTPMP